MLRTLDLGGWSLLWLAPYRLGFFLLYAIGWRELLRPYDREPRAGFLYVFWVTTVRDAIDRLLPVASVGGGVAAVRLMRWRGLATTPVVASVIVEILLTLAVVYLFTAIGLLLLAIIGGPSREFHRIVLVFGVTMPVPVAIALLLRYGSVFKRLQRLLRPLVGARLWSEGAASLDHELAASLRRGRVLLLAGTLQLVALASASFEVWFALRLFGHPVAARTAVAMESLTQASRYLAFVVPAGLGVQEAAFVAFGHLLGMSGVIALAVSMAKRLRELLCGLPSLISWQWAEGRRLRGL